MRTRSLLLAVAGGLLSGSAFAQAPDQSDVIIRGQYQAILGDCAACHTKAGTPSLAGGNPLQTPFGPIVPPNITPDVETGVGNWTFEDFRSMMRSGVGHDGIRLYPAMPYTAYTKMTDQDLSDLWTYLQTIEPVHNEVDANQLPFPFNIRMSLLGWNIMNLSEGEYKPDPTKSEAWNRGAYIVQGAGHCSTCHTPKNILGADKDNSFLQGGSLQGWFAPDITNNQRSGLGTWTIPDVVTYLKTGTNAKTVASGPMAEAVQNSTSKMNDEDLVAIATYLKSLPGKESPKVEQPRQTSMASGQAVYRDNCSACHGSAGTGAMPLFPALAGNPIVMQDSSETLSHLVLFGSQGVATSSSPTTPSMPSLGWRLSDKEVADVLTYIRNTWGNSGAAVSESDVSSVRKQ
jgi:mono/diheme cytochrome c family protein